MKSKNLDEKLLEYALEGKRDGYKNLAANDKKAMLDKLIAEKFGIGEEKFASD
jgi:hypothetical protein